MELTIMTYRKSMSEAIREVQESTIKPYVSMSMGGQYNVLDKDSKVVYSTRDKTLAYDKLKEELQETPQGFALVSKAKEIAKKFANNMSKAVAEIEKLEKGLSNNSSVKDALQKANESLEIDEEVSLQEVSDKLKLAVLKKKIKQYKDKVFKKTMSTVKSPLFAGYEEMEEGRMKDIFTADQEGKSAEEIAKLMKLPLKTVKNILGEEVFEEQILEFTSDMIKRLQKSYSTMPKKISPEQATALSKHLDRLDLASLKQLTKAKIPFVTTLARNKVYKKTGKFEAVEEPKKDVSKETDTDKIKLAKEKDTDALEKQLIAAQGQINILKTKLENEKNKVVKPEPNPKTGEVPLTVGVAYKHFKDDEDKEKKEVKKEETINEFKKMTVTFKNMNDMSKASTDLAKQGFTINAKGTVMKVDGKGDDLNKYATDLKNFYGAKIVAEENLKELSKAERDKRIQRAKDMIKYYDAQKKAALKGPNKALAKKMLKNDSEDEPREKKKETPPLDTTGVVEMAKDSSAHAIGMSQAMKSTGDKPPLDKSTIKKGHKIAKAILNTEEKRVYVESMAGLRKKADKSGMPYSILKKVFDRGMAAWKSGHRPGASQQQWAYARVNSFITKSSGTWGGADKDLAKQVKG